MATSAFGTFASGPTSDDQKVRSITCISAQSMCFGGVLLFGLVARSDFTHTHTHTRTYGQALLE